MRCCHSWVVWVAEKTPLQKQAGKAGKPMGVAAGPSTYYGETELLKQRQRAMPMGQAPTESVGRVNAKKPTVRPGSLPPLIRPTERMEEPITQGANFGPGLNAFQAGIVPMDPRQEAINELRMIAQMYPSTGILDLLDKYGG
jgi:hypothetical protein